MIVAMEENITATSTRVPPELVEQVAEAAREAVWRELVTISHTHESAAQAAYDAVLSALSV